MIANQLEEGDSVLCTVDRIIGTVVFVKIEGLDKDIEGSIVTSEIAPGRIRNLRDYVIPKKRIVCKVLRIAQNGNVDLSLRRVTQKEAKEVLEQYGQEKSYKSVLKSITGDRSEEIIKEIEKRDKIYNFIKSSQENPKELEKIVGKESAKKILEIVSSQKKKNTLSKKEILLSTFNPNGVELIKKILSGIKNAEIRYLAAGRYSISVEDSDPKISGNKLKNVLLEIEQLAKNSKLEFSIKEK